MENTLSLVFMGAYAFFCLDVVIKMSLRILNYEDYSTWQRHLYAAWGVTTAYILLQSIWDITKFHYHLDWDLPICYNIRIFTLLTVQLCGIMLWTLTSHRVIRLQQIWRHLIPFVIVVIIVCFLHSIKPEWHSELFLYGLELVYSVIMIHLCITNTKSFNLHLYQSYTDTHKRTLNWTSNLLWQFLVAYFLYCYFCWFETSLHYIFYPLIMITWYYINWNILTMRDTREVEILMMEQTEAEELEKAEAKALANNDKESATVAKQSLRELTKQRLEENLEEVCLSRRLYLNPDLTVNDLAMELNTNRTYISQYFSEHHTTFLKYINDLRVEYAMYQLKNTNNKLSTVMADSGFRHTETFKRAFISRYNCEPKDVRKG